MSYLWLCLNVLHGLMNDMAEPLQHVGSRWGVWPCCTVLLLWDLLNVLGPRFDIPGR
jgi:hypothetical protein